MIIFIYWPWLNVANFSEEDLIKALWALSLYGKLEGVDKPLKKGLLKNVNIFFDIRIYYILSLKYD